jgi:hypothetical protein
LKEVLNLDNESITVDPREALTESPVSQGKAISQAPKTWPGEEETNEIALLKAFLCFSAIACCLIVVILFALMNHSGL